MMFITMPSCLQIFITACVLLLSHITTANVSKCNPTNGPSGITECVLLWPYYTKYQTATCLTDSYIRAKSASQNKQHRCRDSSSTYCWYQCMIEIYNLDNGPVYSSCACDPSATTTQSVITSTTIPNWCYSPDGTQCNWYRECLEKRHPCSGTKNSYALDYAEHFCKLFSERSSKFSTKGQKWIDGVRKCLQVALVPILRPWNDGISCDQIKNKAFDSHSGCYLTPGFDAPSICDIGVKDWWSTFWTIKGSITKTPLRSLAGMYEVASQCGLNLFKNKDEISLLHFDTERNTKSREKRSIQLTSDDQLEYAENIGLSIAKASGWSEIGVAWFAFYSHSSSNPSDVEIRVALLISVRRIFDLNSENSPLVNVSSTVQKLAEAVSNGTISIENGARITRMVGCVTSSCNSTFVDVEGKSVPSKSVHVHDCGVCMQLIAAFLMLSAIFK